MGGGELKEKKTVKRKKLNTHRRKTKNGDKKTETSLLVGDSNLL